MAFGQPSGPPASRKQVRDLLELLQAAGHTDFRDARGPMGFNQRQAGGKFTRDEAQAFIDQLEQAEPENPEPEAGVVPTRRPAPAARPSAVERAVREASNEMLAAELQQRGWIVIEP